MIPTPSHLVLFFHKGHVVKNENGIELRFSQGERYALEFDFACECVGNEIAVVDDNQASHNTLSKSEIATMNASLKPAVDEAVETEEV